MHTYEERCETIANKSPLAEGPWMINPDGSLGVSHLEKFAPIKPRKSAPITKTDRTRKLYAPVGKKYVAKYSEEDRLFKKKMLTAGVKGKLFFAGLNGILGVAAGDKVAANDKNDKSVDRKRRPRGNLFGVLG
jgi:hypothetical protein